jgi:hypothetical protein
MNIRNHNENKLTLFLSVRQKADPPIGVILCGFFKMLNIEGDRG